MFLEPILRWGPWFCRFCLAETVVKGLQGQWGGTSALLMLADMRTMVKTPYVGCGHPGNLHNGYHRSLPTDGSPSLLSGS